MNHWIVLPFDGESIARVTLRRAAQYIPYDDMRSGGIMLAVAAEDGPRLQSMLDDARAVVGPSVTLDARILPCGDPAEGLCRITDALPDAMLAVPILCRRAEYHEALPWFMAAAPHALQASPWFTVAFFITEGELVSARRTTDERSSLDRFVSALLHGLARLRAGRGPALERPTVKGATP